MPSLLNPGGRQTIIDSLPPTERQRIDMALLAGTASYVEIAAQLGIAPATVKYYKTKKLIPLVKLAQSARHDAKQKSARAKLAWLFQQVEDSVEMAMKPKKVLTKSGEVVEVGADLSAVAPLIKAGTEIARTELELDKEINQPSPGMVLNADTIQVIKAMSFPKSIPSAQTVSQRVIESGPVGES